MLLLRVTIGLLFVGHGAQHALGWFGGYGADGTGQWLEGFGFPHGRRLALFLGGSEMAVGVLFGAGFLLPAAAAGIVGIALAAARTDHAGKGPWIWRNGYEYVLILGLVAVTAVLAGPGSLSVDRGLGLDLAGTAWGLATAAAGLASGAAVLATRRRPASMGATATGPAT